MVQTNADIRESLMSFNCIVGQKGCIYKNKQSLAQGKMTKAAKTSITKKLVKKPIVKPKKAVPAKKPVAAVQKKSVAKPVAKKPAARSQVSKPTKKIQKKPVAKTNVQVQGNADLRMKKKLMKNIKDPLNETEAKIKSTMKK